MIQSPSYFSGLYGIIQNTDILERMFNHGLMEALSMRRLKRDLWKIGIIITGMLLFFVLMMWPQVAAVRPYAAASGLATPGTVTVQVTPTEDATVTALNKEKLAQEVQQLKQQNEPDFLGWLRMNISTLLSTVLVVGGGIFGLVRYLAERRVGNLTLWLKGWGPYDRKSTESSNLAILPRDHAAPVLCLHHSCL